ncbi:MAG: RidA family protein [Candidatus Cyclobacteriaceae bacterium M3_2C_046]
MENRINISSGAKWEDLVGYSRAVKMGQFIEISGTTAIDQHNQVVGKGDIYEQTRFIIEKIRITLQKLGADLSHVVRTRMYVTDISQWEQAGRAHGAFFKDIKPATSMIEVKALIEPELLIEIEATAIMDH